jgi:hypothetical protein
VDSRIQILAIIVTAGLLAVIFELVRRRRLMERYALLWLLSAVVLLGLAIWRGLLEDLSSALGIVYPPNALFAVAFGFVLALLLHFSLAISRLSDETKVLAQEIARLDEQMRSQAGSRETIPEEQVESLEAMETARTPVRFGRR